MSLNYVKNPINGGWSTLEEVSICLDCSNEAEFGGELESRDEVVAAIRAAHTPKNGGSHCYFGFNETKESDEFSWSACDTCGSTLGGSRHHYVIVEWNVPAPAVEA